MQGQNSVKAVLAHPQPVLLSASPLFSLKATSLPLRSLTGLPLACFSLKTFHTESQATKTEGWNFLEHFATPEQVAECIAGPQVTVE